jgi:methionyl-tRNA formyltransferase
MRLVFMGTPEFAVKSLEVLNDSTHEIAAVITAPDKPRGRGRKITPTPVKEAALNYGLPVLQPKNLKSPDFIRQLEEYQPDLNVVVAFRILPEAVFTLPRLGSVNLHASLLPKYRGAAPINWAIIRGETVTGVTTFLLDKSVDTGAILMQREVAIAPDDDAGSVHDRLMEIGAGLLLDTVDGLAGGTIKPQEQPATGATPAPKLSPEIVAIDWLKPAEELFNFIRGLSPYPGAYSVLGERKITILKAEIIRFTGTEQPGTIIDSNPREGLTIACGRNALRIIMMKPQGKKIMGSAEFVRGYHVEAGSKFQS